MMALIEEKYLVQRAESLSIELACDGVMDAAYKAMEAARVAAVTFIAAEF